VSKYSSQIATAFRLLKQKGQKFTLLRLADSADYNPVTPGDTAVEVAFQTTCHGVVLPSTQGTIEAFDNRILDDPAQRRAFRFCILAAQGLDFEPQAQDVLLTAEGPWRILGATPLNPAGDGAILFNVGATLDTQINLGSYDPMLYAGGTPLAVRT